MPDDHLLNLYLQLPHIKYLDFKYAKNIIDKKSHNLVFFGGLDDGNYEYMRYYSVDRTIYNIVKNNWQNKQIIQRTLKHLTSSATSYKLSLELGLEFYQKVKNNGLPKSIDKNGVEEMDIDMNQNTFNLFYKDYLIEEVFYPDTYLQIFAATLEQKFSIKDTLNLYRFYSDERLEQKHNYLLQKIDKLLDKGVKRYTLSGIEIIDLMNKGVYLIDNFVSTDKIYSFVPVHIKTNKIIEVKYFDLTLKFYDLEDLDIQYQILDLFKG